MTADAHLDWLTANQRALMAGVGRLRAILDHGDVAAAEGAWREAEESMPSPSAVDRVVTTFGLSPFERDVLLLCAAMELDGGFAAAHQSRVTFGLALAALPDAHWSALAPLAPLRRWRLVEVDAAQSLTNAPLRIDERILHYLAGVAHLDERWSALVTPLPAPQRDLPQSHAAIAESIGHALAALEQASAPMLIELAGNDTGGKKDIAASVAAAAGMRVYAMTSSDIPVQPGDRDALARLWEREAILGGAALLIDTDDQPPDARRTVAAFVERIHTLTFITGREPLHLPRISPTRFEIWKPSFAEQRNLWEATLGTRAARLNGELDRIVAQFDLSAQTIASAVTVSRESDLWDHCRSTARTRMLDLAKRVIPVARWDDLILPPQQHATLREIVAHVRQRSTVYQRWGFAGAGSRGLGISALFAGVSGTGKTMAAEVLANELQLDLFQIDLSSVVSKYIGETEENLRRVFDAAEEGGAILLFDEADALFGKRTEVKDSHDRYANIEVSYLLQRMESYRGVAILTTNLKNALDSAFLRRIRFVVDFPFPDASHRAAIWQRVFPPGAPLDGIDPARLARLNVPGGSIRNIAVNAAFLAAEASEPVRMAHILAATRSEYAKLERPLTEAETGGWV